MRFASIIDNLIDAQLSAINPPIVNPENFGFLAQVLPHPAELARDLLMRYVDKIPNAKPTNTDWYVTLGLGPHTDDVTGDVTIGVVSQGDHYLFTGSNWKVGDLKPGTVFLLHNKKLHGAMPNDKKHPTPLVFAAIDISVAYTTAHRALVKKGEK